MYQGSLPVRLPPGLNIDEVIHRHHPTTRFDLPLVKIKTDQPLPSREPIDLDPDEGQVTTEDNLAELPFYQPDSLPLDSLFAFLRLSSADFSRDETLDELHHNSTLIEDMKNKA